MDRIGITRLATAALAVAAGCGGEERQGTVVSAPPDSATSFLDDPCTRQGAERRKLFHVTDEGFEPRRVVIRTGAPVTFINCGDEPHTVTKTSGRGPDYDSGTLEPKEKFERTFTAIGTHRIGDERNPGAEMVIEVEGLPGEPQN